MANVRINALTTTATSAANDDYLAIDGTTNGTRKILGSSFALLSGATFTGTITSTLGTITTSTPALDMSQTWNAAGTTFTALKLNVTNTASGASSNLMDLQVGGVSKALVTKDGVVKATSASSTTPAFQMSGETSGWAASSGVFYFTSSGQQGLKLSANTAAPYVQFNDIQVGRYLSGTALYQNNGSTAQNYHLTRTADVDTNYERVAIGWTGTQGKLYTEAGGTGTSRDLVLGTNATTALTISGTTQEITAGQTWNAAGTNFTALKVNVTNTASGASSNLMDLQVGGVSQFSVGKGGRLQSSTGNVGGLIVTQSGSGSGWEFLGNSAVAWSSFGGNYPLLFNYGGQLGVGLASGSVVSWSSSSNASMTGDVRLSRDAANILALSGGSAHAFRLYNTYTSSTNYERLGLNWATNVAQIYTEKGSGGGTARDLVLGTNATTAISIDATSQKVTIASGKDFQVGSAYVATPQTNTGYITIYDNTGTAYKVMVAA